MPKQLSALFTWRTSICRSDLAPTSRHVALTLSLWMNEMGGSAYPGTGALADATGLAASTVRSHLARLVDAGYLALVERGGIKGERRRANVWEARTPDLDPAESRRGQPDPEPDDDDETPPRAGRVDDETPPRAGRVDDETPPADGGVPRRETASTPPGAGAQDDIEDDIEASTPPAAGAAEPVEVVDDLDTSDGSARAIVSEWWDYRSAGGLPTPVVSGDGGNAYIAIAKIVARLIDAGHAETAIKWALADVADGPWTLNTLLFAMMQRAGKSQATAALARAVEADEAAFAELQGIGS